jgi:hypothetical protein
MATRKKCSTDINLLIENGALEMLKKKTRPMAKTI